MSVLAINSSGSAILYLQLESNSPQKKVSVCNQAGYCGKRLTPQNSPNFIGIGLEPVGSDPVLGPENMRPESGPKHRCRRMSTNFLCMNFSNTIRVLELPGRIPRTSSTRLRRSETIGSGLHAVKNNGAALQFLPAFQRDREAVRQAVRCKNFPDSAGVPLSCVSREIAMRSDSGWHSSMHPFGSVLQDIMPHSRWMGVGEAMP